MDLNVFPYETNSVLVLVRSHAERDRKGKRERKKKKASFPEDFPKVMPN